MGRMIDAGLFLDNLSGRLESMKDYDAVKDVINNMPTAYDPDKVVEQLNDCSMWKELLVYEMTHREREIVKRAIEIVKGGGVNDR